MYPIKAEIIRRIQPLTQAELKKVAAEVDVSWQTLQFMRKNPERDSWFSTVAKLARHYQLRASDFDTDNGRAA